MTTNQVLHTELTRYQLLSEELKARYREIDGEALADTLDGICDLQDLLREFVRSSLEDETLAKALRSRMEEMGARLNRFRSGAERKRQLVCSAMTSAGLERLLAEDFSVSVRNGPPRLEIASEQAIPEEFFIPQPSKLDRTLLIAKLKRGSQVPGDVLTGGQIHIAVRVK